MAYSKLPSRFSFILLGPQREAFSVPANNRTITVAYSDRTATVPKTSSTAYT